jgi:plasmid maintenance system antidote protein VapI
VTIATMPRAKTTGTMTELLRDALTEADSLRGVARATGLNHASLVRFVNGERSLRLDLADRLGTYLGIECWRVRQQGADA